MPPSGWMSSTSSAADASSTLQPNPVLPSRRHGSPAPSPSSTTAPWIVAAVCLNLAVLHRASTSSFTAPHGNLSSSPNLRELAAPTPRGWFLVPAVGLLLPAVGLPVPAVGFCRPHPKLAFMHARPGSFLVAHGLLPLLDPTPPALLPTPIPAE
ncbi:hypothetical protein QYE76_024141 [Lolium multiflorum]|uniref:Uncharacterized protein n=1 Tax=Lolium multiflorum TaxID=4521 RepID=A0AAD8REJ1_LOLMU|nr:hypothetical protein QYE76_024141 [Lolium multiflorum]